MDIKTRPLGQHLLLAITLIQLVIFTLLFWVLNGFVSQKLMDNFIDTVRSSAHEASEYLVRYDAFSSQEDVHQALDQMLLKPSVVYAEIVLENKHYLPELIAHNDAIRFREDREVGEHGDQIYFLSMPLIEQDRLAFLRLGYDETAIRSLIRSSRLGILLALAVTGLLSIVAVYYFSRHLTRPLHRLAELSRNVAADQDSPGLKLESPVQELQILSGSLEDMHQKLAARNRRLKHLASTDALTGIPNRLAFSKFLEREVMSHPSGHGYSLVLVDINKFKEVNDTYGHVVGDHVVNAVATRLHKLCRGRDMLARIGGDEFALVVKDMSEITLRRFCMNVHDTIATPITINNNALEITVSIGATLITESDVPIEEYMHQADIAMYEAKRNNEIYNLFGHQRFEENLRANVIKKGLRDKVSSYSAQGIYLAYQPCFAASNYTMQGVEALLRWDHKELGSVAPRTLIPLAEKEGLMPRLTDFILDTAADQAREWFDLGHAVPVAINLSVADLSDKALETRLTSAYQRYDIPYHLLVMEISESVLLKDLELSHEVLGGLRRRGIPIWIDDYGSTQSSRQVLQALPVDGVKISARDLRGPLDDRDKLSKLKQRMEEARELALRILVKGVETEDLAELMSELAADALQGFHFARPVPPSFIESNFLNQR